MSGSVDQSNGATPDEEIANGLLEQAAVWHARMRDILQNNVPSASPAVHQQEFSTWLQADPKHRAALAEIESLWGALEKPVADILAQHPELVSVSTQNARTSRWHHIVPAAFSSTGRLRAGLVGVSLALVMGIMLTNVSPWSGPQADFETSVGEKSPIVLADGSRVTLNTDSAMTVEMTSTERRVTLLRGEAWFDVSSADPRPFCVTTEHGLIWVTGTSFDVRVEQGNAIVSLTEGRVELSAGERTDHIQESDPNGVEHARSLEPSVLLPGEQAVLSQGTVSPATPFDKTTLTAWLRGQFVFYNTPLSEVVDTLNRYRPGHVMVINSSLADLKVSGVFSTKDPDKALDLIVDTLPVQLFHLTDYLVFLR